MNWQKFWHRFGLHPWIYYELRPTVLGGWPRQMRYCPLCGCIEEHIVVPSAPSAKSGWV